MHILCICTTVGSDQGEEFHLPWAIRMGIGRPMLELDVTVGNRLTDEMTYQLRMILD